MKKIEIEDYVFHYIEEGAGEPLIFLHGSISDLRTWENQIKPFAKHFHTIAYSRRYHYPTDSGDNISDYTVPRHSKDLLSFIEALNLNNVNIVGSSYGAYTGLLAATERPDLFNSLVLCEPPVLPLIVSNVNNPLHILSLLFRDYPTGKSFLKFGVKAAFPATKQLKKGNLKEGVRIFANGVLGEGGFEKLPKEIQMKILENAIALKAELLGPVYTSLSKEDLSKVKAPVMVVCGENSPHFFHSISEKLHKLLPVSKKITIPDAAHDMHQENPKLYNQKVLEFLG